MIVQIFLILVAISVFLICLGHYTKETAYSLIGFFFLFLLSATIIIPGNLQYETGENTTQTYNYINGSISTINEISTNKYTDFNSSSARWFGIWLTVISSLGMAITGVDIKKIRTEGK